MKNVVYGAWVVLAGCILALSASAEPDSSMKRIEKAYRNFDENNDGKVTQEEFLSFWEARFRATDKNDDGVIDQTEFLDADRFQARDTNKDGVIEFDEDLAMRKRGWSVYSVGKKGWLSLDDYASHARGLRARSGYNRETTFTKMDANHDGILTEDEYLAFWEEYFTNRDANRDDRLNPAEHRHEDSFESFDADRNGTIERQEDALVRKKYFQELDLDGDGALTQSEFVR